MEGEIVKEDLRGLKKRLAQFKKEWKELAIYLCCVLSKHQLMLDLKDEMEDFFTHFKLSCIASDQLMVQRFISCALLDLNLYRKLANQSLNKGIIEMVFQKSEIF